MKKNNADTKNQNDIIRPAHYQSDIEVWEQMIRIWGAEQFIIYCKINAFKYRMRAGKKPGNSIHDDIEKALWYEKKIEELSK